MTRKARSKVLYDGCFAHVFSRSIEAKHVFSDVQDFDACKSMLLQAKKKHPFMIHHYCLMHTHFHLAVSIPKLTDFSDALQRFKWAYTTYFNHKYKRRGPLWQNRFKSLVIEDDRYLHACGLYIEANPVQAKLVEDMTEWPYSSSRFYILGEKDDLLDGYEKPPLPDDIDLQKATLFTKGNGIGSKFFKLQLKEELSPQVL